MELEGVRARRQACVREGRSTLGHILALRTLFEQEVSIGRCLYSCLLISRKTFDTVPCDKLGARLRRLGVPLHLQHVVKAMYTLTYAKVQIKWQHTWWSSTCTCPIPPTLFGLYIDELDTYLDKIDEVFTCLLNSVVAILLYVDYIFILSIYGASL